MSDKGLRFKVIASVFALQVKAL